MGATEHEARWQRPGPRADAWTCRALRLRARAVQPLTRPHSEFDVDRDLWSLLDIASNEELVEVYDILFGVHLTCARVHACCVTLQPRMGVTNCKSHACALLSSIKAEVLKEAGTSHCAVACSGASPLSPLIKSLVADAEPAAIGLRGRASLMHRIESRFRFLAVRNLHAPSFMHWRVHRAW